MKNSRTMIMSAFLVIAAAASASAQTQNVTINIQAINEVAVTGGAQTLTINAATAGNAPDDATASATWAVTTNQSGAKVSASIGTAMPANVDLMVELAAPVAGGTSAGQKSIAAGSTVDLVTGLSYLNEGGMALTYTVRATSAATVQSIAKTVTYTITGGV